MRSWVSPIFGKYIGKIEILSTRFFTVKNVQLSLGKLKLRLLSSNFF